MVALSIGLKAVSVRTSMRSLALGARCSRYPLERSLSCGPVPVLSAHALPCLGSPVLNPSPSYARCGGHRSTSSLDCLSPRVHAFPARRRSSPASIAPNSVPLCPLGTSSGVCGLAMTVSREGKGGGLVPEESGGAESPDWGSVEDVEEVEEMELDAQEDGHCAEGEEGGEEEEPEVADEEMGEACPPEEEVMETLSGHHVQLRGDYLVDLSASEPDVDEEDEENPDGGLSTTGQEMSEELAPHLVAQSTAAASAGQSQETEPSLRRDFVPEIAAAKCLNEELFLSQPFDREWDDEHIMLPGDLVPVHNMISVRRSVALVALLRHEAPRLFSRYRSDGFISLGGVVHAAAKCRDLQALTVSEVLQLAAQDDETRFQILGRGGVPTHIRATHGHSFLLESMALVALPLGIFEVPVTLYHATHDGNIRSIALGGLLSGDKVHGSKGRTMVHLVGDPHDRPAKGREVHVIVRANLAAKSERKHQWHLSGSGVYLAREVPIDYLEGSPYEGGQVPRH